MLKYLGKTLTFQTKPTQWFAFLMMGGLFLFSVFCFLVILGWNIWFMFEFFGMNEIKALGVYGSGILLFGWQARYWRKEIKGETRTSSR